MPDKNTKQHDLIASLAKNMLKHSLNKKITFVIMYSFLEWGNLVNKAGTGGSVARAKEARVSIMRLI